jgi:hypothetical protein
MIQFHITNVISLLVLATITWDYYLVFGAPDDLVRNILNAYPKATRATESKGRLPIHLAIKHNASEEVLRLVVEAFPRGFFVKDDTDMLPLDHISANMDRAHMKEYLPLLMNTKVEEERAKWEVEKQEALESQKKALKSDPGFMEHVMALVTGDVEKEYSKKSKLVDETHKKEMQKVKNKHDSETQALLDGFEKKLRTLNNDYQSVYKNMISTSGKSSGRASTMGQLDDIKDVEYSCTDSGGKSGNIHDRLESYLHNLAFLCRHTLCYNEADWQSQYNDEEETWGEFDSGEERDDV